MGCGVGASAGAVGAADTLIAAARTDGTVYTARWVDGEGGGDDVDE